jgi:hypothetical protein
MIPAQARMTDRTHSLRRQNQMTSAISVPPGKMSSMAA